MRSKLDRIHRRNGELHNRDARAAGEAELPGRGVGTACEGSKGTGLFGVAGEVEINLVANGEVVEAPSGHIFVPGTSRWRGFRWFPDRPRCRTGKRVQPLRWRVPGLESSPLAKRAAIGRTGQPAGVVEGGRGGGGGSGWVGGGKRTGIVIGEPARSGFEAVAPGSFATAKRRAGPSPEASAHQALAGRGSRRSLPPTLRPTPLSTRRWGPYPPEHLIPSPNPTRARRR